MTVCYGQTFQVLFGEVLSQRQVLFCQRLLIGYVVAWRRFLFQLEPAESNDGLETIFLSA